jgi:hypothetical protein
MKSTTDKRAPAPREGKLRDEALRNPKETFATPMDVVKTPLLPDEDKKHALETWEQDEEALQRATGEGMGGGERPHLRSVKEAEQALDERTKRAEKAG